MWNIRLCFTVWEKESSKILYPRGHRFFRDEERGCTAIILGIFCIQLFTFAMVDKKFLLFRDKKKFDKLKYSKDDCE